MTKKFMMALASVAMISTSASAGNLISPAQDPEVIVIPEFEPATAGSLGGSLGNSGGLVLGVLGLLVLGGIASSGGS